LDRGHNNDLNCSISDVQINDMIGFYSLIAHEQPFIIVTAFKIIWSLELQQLW